MGKLTAMGVKNLTEPGRYSDGEGLILKLAAKGKGSWIVRVQANGKRRDIGLGPLSELPLADAREAARALRKEVKAGVDVLAERKKEALVIPTFSDAARLVHEEHKVAWKNGKHQAQWIKTLETYAFPTLGDKLVSEIEGPAIRDALSPIWLTKPETARRVRQRIGSVLDWACAKGFRETEAPMRSVLRGLPRQPKKQSHFAAMPYPDLPAFITWLRGRSSVGRLALEFVILNASRSGEVRGACWNEIDLKKKLWTIPAERMKAGTAHVVPLSEAALDVLKRAKALRSPFSELVFPGQNPRRQLSDMTLLKILRDKGDDYTVHGFRSSFRDWVAEKTNYPGEVAEAALAHAIANKVEAAY
ncbi:MAG: integrase arm-type DNA-binding domain-containing protein, partial [Pseudomonadota bacterium]